MNAPHATGCASRGGRPPNPEPRRDAGRHGQIWDDCEQQAKQDGQTMTAFVAAALRRELDWRRHQAATQVN